MTRAELRASCPSNDTGGYIEWLEERVLALTADEEPRKAAERIALDFMVTGVGIREMLVNSITTAIQAASNAQLERGRKALEHEKKQGDVIFRDAARRDHVSHVREFMRTFQQHIGDTPSFPPQEVLDLRVKLIAEEFAEMLEAAGYPYVVRVCRRGGGLWDGDGPALFDKEAFRAHTADLPAFVDALLDLEYVTLGTHVACGVDPQPIWERVHAANMAKQPAADKHSKITKPDGWQAPDIAGALKEQGWQGGAE